QAGIPPLEPSECQISGQSLLIAKEAFRPALAAARLCFTQVIFDLRQYASPGPRVETQVPVKRRQIEGDPVRRQGHRPPFLSGRPLLPRTAATCPSAASERDGQPPSPCRSGDGVRSHWSSRRC